MRRPRGPRGLHDARPRRPTALRRWRRRRRRSIEVPFDELACAVGDNLEDILGQDREPFAFGKSRDGALRWEGADAASLGEAVE